MSTFAFTAFLMLLLFAIFELRYMLLVWKAQRPEAFSGSWETMRREISLLYSRFYVAVFAGLVLLYQFQSRFDVLLFGFLGFWVQLLA